MPKFTSEMIKTDITSVKLTLEHILIGVGGELHIYCKKSHKLSTKTAVFEGQKIYGIEFAPLIDTLLLYGSNKLKLIVCDASFSKFEATVAVNTNDWILSAKWIDKSSKLATVSMHNVLTLWSSTLEKLKCVTCEERCILYSSCICNDNWNELIVLSGTVFTEVLIWWPANGDFTLSPVLYRLQGHKGVIFSLSYKSDLGFICSTSDDRSAKLWQIQSKNLVRELKQPQINIKLRCTVFGHTSRIFRCLILSHCFLTAGEDSLVNVWTFEGTLMRKIDCHQGDSVWSLDYDEEDDLLITGGGDSGAVLFKLNTGISQDELNLADGCVPKKVVALHSGRLLIISEDGALYYYAARRWVLIKRLENLKSYALLEVSLCRNLVALAGYSGSIHVYRESRGKIEAICSYKTKKRQRIYSLHWLTCTLFVTCQENGFLTLWFLTEETLREITTLILPSCKERWTTTACLISPKHLVVGDRKGNIHLFRFGTVDPLQTLRKAHNYLGVTQLRIEANGLFSLGRDGVVKSYNFDFNEQFLHESSSNKLPFSWLVRLYQHVLLAYSGNAFVIWDRSNRRILLEKDCGGGHRSWDFHTNSEGFLFVYVKNKLLNTVACKWESLCPVNVMPGFHCKEINSIEILPLRGNSKLFISGGEDTTLRVSQITDGTFITRRVLKAHLSSVRTIVSCQVCSETVNNELTVTKFFILSAGGRAQIVLWEIITIEDQEKSVIDFKCNEMDSYYQPLGTFESEMRIMDLAVVKSGVNAVVLFAACSDGNVEVFRVQTNNPRLSLYSKFAYQLKCILKIGTVSILGRLILFTMATDGKVVFWDCTEVVAGKSELCIIPEPFYSLLCHQSGINSYSYKILDFNSCLFVTGGDDNAITVNYIRFLSIGNKLQVELLDTYSNCHVHWAQVTGVFLTNDFIFTSSIDQRIIVYKWSLVEFKIEIEVLGRYNTSVADLQGLRVFENNDRTYFLVVYGKGMEIVKISM